MISKLRSVSPNVQNPSIVDLIHDWNDIGGHGCLQRTDTLDKTLPAPAFYVGWQEGSRRIGGGFALFTLTEAIPGHCQWSTVSGNTLVAAGFRLPSGTVAPQDLKNRDYHLNAR